jgi:hypothetical protein
MSELADTIKRVASFADTKGNDMFTMSDVHFRKGSIYVQTITGGAIEPIDLELDCGVNASKLIKALKAVGKDPTFTQTDRQLQVKSGSSTAKLSTSLTKDAPKFHRPPNTIAWVEIPHLHIAHRMAWAVCDDIGRSHLGGVALTSCGMCATNGHVALKYGSVNYTELLHAQEPPNIPVSILKGLPDPTCGVLDQGRLFLAAQIKPKAKPTTFRSANLFSGLFPPMEQILVGARKEPQLIVDRKALIDLLKRARLSAPAAILEVKGTRLSVRVDSAAVNPTEETLFGFADSVEFRNVSSKVPDGIVGMGLAYLISAIETATSDNVILGMLPVNNGSIDPVYLVDGDYEAVLMPRRL